MTPPPGWAEAKLGEIAETSLGKMLSQKSKLGLNPKPYLRNKNVQWGRIDVGDLLEMDFDDAEWDFFRLRPGDLLVCEGGEVGRAAIWRGDAEVAFQKALHRVRPAEGVEPVYLRYLLDWMARANAFERYVTGSTISHLPQETLRALPIPLAPLVEQRRIVAAIEEQFSRLDATEASLNVQLRRLESLRRSITESAVRGDWPTMQLGELISALRNGTFVSRPAAAPPGVPIFRISAVRPMSLNPDDVRYAPASAAYDGFFVDEDDLLFTRYSGNPAYVGACARVPRLSERTLHPDKLIRVVPDKSKIDSAFLELACSAGTTADEIRGRRKTTAGQVGIAGSQLRTVQVPLPPLDEQRRIVADVEQQFSLIDSLRAAVESAQKRSAALRRSILERAFRGELVPQDPDDEPASALLERIRAERTAAPAPRRRRRAAA